MRKSGIWAGTVPISISDIPQTMDNAQNACQPLSTATIKWHHLRKTTQVCRPKSSHPFVLQTQALLKQRKDAAFRLTHG